MPLGEEILQSYLLLPSEEPRLPQRSVITGKSENRGHVCPERSCLKDMPRGPTGSSSVTLCPERDFSAH